MEGAGVHHAAAVKVPNEQGPSAFRFTVTGVLCDALEHGKQRQRQERAEEGAETEAETGAEQARGVHAGSAEVERFAFPVVNPDKRRPSGDGGPSYARVNSGEVELDAELRQPFIQLLPCSPRQSRSCESRVARYIMYEERWHAQFGRFVSRVELGFCHR